MILTRFGRNGLLLFIEGGPRITHHAHVLFISPIPLDLNFENIISVLNRSLCRQDLKPIRRLWHSNHEFMSKLRLSLDIYLEFDFILRLRLLFITVLALSQFLFRQGDRGEWSCKEAYIIG